VFFDQAYNNMGSIFVDCDMLEEATECYGIALNIKHTRAHQGLARIHYLKNRKLAAFDEMTKLVKIATNSASAFEKRSEYGERDAAVCDLNTATLLDPTRTYPYRYRAAGGSSNLFRVRGLHSPSPNCIKQLTSIDVYSTDMTITVTQEPHT
jgi:hypothetical protein